MHTLLCPSARAGCLENFFCHGRCHRFEMHPIPQVLNPLGETIDSELPPFVKIVGPQFTVHFMVGEHVKDITHH